MSASAREVIVTAAADCPQVLIRGDVYELGDTIIAALSAAGFVVVPREPTEEMVSALWNALENDIPHTVTFRAALKVAISAAEGKK